jgi:hypothetical protein
MPSRLGASDTFPLLIASAQRIVCFVISSRRPIPPHTVGHPMNESEAALMTSACAAKFERKSSGSEGHSLPQEPTNGLAMLPATGRVDESGHRAPDQSAEIAHWSDYQPIRRRLILKVRPPRVHVSKLFERDSLTDKSQAQSNPRLTKLN